MKQFISDGKISEPEDILTQSFINSIVAGLARYSGTGKTSKESGMERPIKVLIGGDTDSESVLQMFEEALETAGYEHGNAGILPVPAINFSFFDISFDYAISVMFYDNKYNIEFFERGDDLGELQHGLPLSQLGVDYIETAIHDSEDYRTNSVELHEDLHEDAEDRYESHLINYLNKIGPVAEGSDQRKEINLTGLTYKIEESNSTADLIAKKVFSTLGAVEDENASLSFKFSHDGKKVSIFTKDHKEIPGPEPQDFVCSFLGVPTTSDIVKLYDDTIILPNEPIPDGILTALLVSKIMLR